MTAPAPHHRRHRWDFLPHATSVQRFNRAVAIKVTAGVGSMYCAYAFCVVALIGLPTAVQQSFPHGGGFQPLPLVQWVAQTFLQLVLLAVILVGQNVTGEASDARAVKTLEDTEAIITQLAEVLAAVGEARKDFARTIQAVSGKMGGKT